MSSKEIKEYYDSTKNSDVRSDLVYAVGLIEAQRIASEEGFIDADSELLPYEEKEVKRLYYTAPHMWLGDRMIEFVLWGVNQVLKPALRFAKGRKRRPIREEQ